MLKDTLDTTNTPFHAGERSIQARYGLEEKMQDFGSRVIRDHLISQHQQFYQQLPFLFVGTVDGKDRPWASMLTGRPGFIQVPDDTTLKIRALPLPGDPLNRTLAAGIDIGLLGMMFNTRRRNRLNGRISTVINGEFDVDVLQSFGNCPKYIQQRDFRFIGDTNPAETEQNPVTGNDFSSRERELITRSDTLFIASQFSEDKNNRSHGVDVSHRGGMPGFVRVEDENTLLIPDFSGNNHFNTLGNLLLNPKAGLLFIDFERGNLLYATGKTDIIFSGEEVQGFSGAERVIRFTLDEYIFTSQVLPIQWQFKEYSKFLTRTGSWN